MKRSDKLERLDTGDYTPAEYDACMKQLGRVGTELGGDRATLAHIDNPKSILDFGCGGGDFTITLGKCFPQAEVIGIDINEQALAYANRQERPSNVRFLQAYDEPVDLLTSTLVCHHLTDEDLIAFLKRGKAQAKQVVINDLHRHPLAYLSFGLIAPFKFRNRLLWEDGLLSIRRSLTRSEWQSLLSQADISDATITWHWPFRWVITYG